MRNKYPDNTFVGPKMPDHRKDLVRLVVGEAPGQEEQNQGVPLVGGSGRIFDSMLRSAGINRDGLTITNTMCCRPPENIFPTDSAARKYISKEDADAAVQHCVSHHLHPLLRGRVWRRVDLLGEKPLRFVGGKSGGIFNWRGSPFTIDLGPDAGNRQLRALATLHPAYVMRDQTMFPVATNDLLKDLTPPPEYYTLFPSLEDVANFKFTTFAFDIESNRATGEITMVGLCAKPYFAIVIPFREPYLAEIKRIFRQGKEVIGHNCVQFDLPMLARDGVKIAPDCQVWDTMLMQHLRFPDFPHDLEFVGSQFCSKPAWKDDKECFQRYNARDVDVTMQAFLQLKELLRQEKLLNLYRLVSVPMAKICRLMHETGFAVDSSQIEGIRAKLTHDMAGLEKMLPVELRTQDVAVNKRQPAPPGTLGKSGKPVKYILVPSTEKVVPWRSTPTKQKYLYETLGIPPIVDPKTERVTTGKIALAKIQNKLKREGRNEEYFTVQAIEKLNKLDELITTFAKEGMKQIGRMHPHFNVHGTSSGRLSSSDPNLQNIPEAARYIYVPSHRGWKIVDVDYSQIENRLTAYFAGDRGRTERFAKDPKFSEHKYAASLFLGIPYEEVVKDNDKDAPYGKAKRIVHGTNYGMGYKKISNMYDMDLRETKRLQDLWKAAILPTTKWQVATGDKAKADGVLTTPFGRKRWFWTSSYYTESLSFLPQSTAADVIFRAMIGLMYERIGWPLELVKHIVRVYEPLPEPARLLIQVHDSLVFECPAELVPRLVTTVQRVMCQPWPELGGLAIPIGVKVGDSWGDAEDYAVPTLISKAA